MVMLAFAMMAVIRHRTSLVSVAKGMFSGMGARFSENEEAMQSSRAVFL